MAMVAVMQSVVDIGCRSEDKIQICNLTNWDKDAERLLHDGWAVVDEK